MTSSIMGSHTSGSGPLSLMSCVRESSPQDLIHDSENDKIVTSKKKFWNPRKWFKRKSSKVAEDVSPSLDASESMLKDVHRSRSTSELSESDEPMRRRSGTHMHPGLSVSHDSIFHSPNSGSELDLEEAQSSSSLSFHHHPNQTELRLQTELSERLRLRRGREDVSEDDEGFPRSPCCNSPTATEGLLERTASNNHPTKSHSTCSDGSLLSMGSSEIEEDSFGQHSSRHSSKLSLSEKKNLDQDSEWQLEPDSVSAPLNHSAAHHKVAVRPKRTHGAPRRKRMQPITGTALPTTPEVNEDTSTRSLSPDTANKETITELYSSTKKSTKTETQLKCSSLPLGLVGPADEKNKLNRSRSNAGSKSQDAFAILGEEEENHDDKKDQSIFARLFLRRSAKKSKNKEAAVPSRTLENSTHSRTMESSTHSRTLETSTHSKTHESFSHSKTLESSTHSTKFSDKRPVESKSRNIPRSGPAFRQRVQPIDIPESSDVKLEPGNLPPPVDPYSKPLSNTPPFHLELETHIKQRKPSSLSNSPPKILPTIESSPELPKSSSGKHFEETRRFAAEYRTSSNSMIPDEPKSRVRTVEETTKHSEETRRFVSEYKTSFVVADEPKSKTTTRTVEETINKVKIVGLSSLQQRVLHQDVDSLDNSYKSLTDFVTNEQNGNHHVATKSHSFRSKTKEFASIDPKMFKSDILENVPFLIEEKSHDTKITKAPSLDSVKKISLSYEVEHSESSESLESANSAKTSLTDYLDSLNSPNSITISGPSHTSVVNISNVKDAQIVDSVKKPQLVTLNVENGEKIVKEEQVVKEQQVSVTKIQVKREASAEVPPTVVSPSLPEFLNLQLNKIEHKPPTPTNVVSVGSPTENEVKPKTVFNFELSSSKPEETSSIRKFSADDIEVIEKDVANNEPADPPVKSTSNPSTPNVVITSMTPPPSFRMFRKHSESSSHVRKSSLVTAVSDSRPKLSLRAKSNSVDIVDTLKRDSISLQTDNMKQKVSSTTDLQDIGVSSEVTLRKKSVIKQRNDDEPELMKVFARRSLKLKDGDDIVQQISDTEIDQIVLDSLENGLTKTSKDGSDKENSAVDSPVEERKKSFIIKEPEKPNKELLIESKFVESTEVVLRNPKNNRFHAYLPKPVANLNVSKVNEMNGDSEKVTVQKIVAVEKPKPEIAEKISNKTWSVQSKDEIVFKKITNDVITNISTKSDYINEDEDYPSLPKNFNQRKAEWEKRAQEAMKKNIP